MNSLTQDDAPRTPAAMHGESGKIGAAILMWFLGVPGIIILLFLLLT